MILLAILLCIIFASFFAGMETGLISADQFLLYTKKEKKIPYAMAADFLLLKPERLLSTTLIGTNIAIVSAAVFLKSFLRDAGIPVWGTWFASLSLSIVLLIFSEIIPKTFMRRYADSITVRLAPVLVVFYFLFLPLAVFLNALVNVILFVFRQHKVKRMPKSREDLRMLLKLMSREAGIRLPDLRVLDDIFNFKEKMAREVMIPYFSIPDCSVESGINNLISLFQKSKARFFIIYTGRSDNIVGYVDIEDLLVKQANSIDEYIRPAVYYPETKRIPDLLLEMNRKEQEIAFLSDEYGIISGMITPDEIASEIVGYIPGENGKYDEEIIEIDKGVYHVPGITDIHELQDVTGIKIKKGSFDTIGGFICERLGEIPGFGKVFEEDGISYKVIDRDDRHIKMVEIKKTKTDDF
ncbi:MAG: HlyC/CorC family transporter [Spirochaetales bacterium]|nr:HlyC/CorC family transporter [Spirochaetales bacterium]